MKFISTLLVIALIAHSATAQSNRRQQPSHRFSVFVSGGAAGSFFVRSYDDVPPSSNYVVFNKKNFLGLGQEVGLAYELRTTTLKIGVQLQQFSKRVRYTDPLATSRNVLIDKPILHQNLIWFAGIDKNFRRKLWTFSPGLGIYYLRPQQEEITIASGFVEDITRNYKNSRLEEGGAYAEFIAERQVGRNMFFGLKGQYFYTLSTGESESITLMPTLRIAF
jgi:hypothetical protein